MHTAPQPTPTAASPARTEPPSHAARIQPQHFVGADAERLAEDPCYFCGQGERDRMALEAAA